MAQSSTSGFDTVLHNAKLYNDISNLLDSVEFIDDKTDCNVDPRLVIVVDVGKSKDTLSVGCFKSEFRNRCFSTNAKILERVSFVLPEYHKDDIVEALKYIAE